MMIRPYLTRFFLALLLGFQLTHLFLIIIFENREISRALLMSVYQLAWIIIPLLTLLILLCYIGIKKLAFPRNPWFYPILLGANLLSASINLFGWNFMTLTRGVILFLSVHLLGFLATIAIGKRDLRGSHVKSIDVLHQSALIFFLAGYFAIFLIAYEVRVSTLAVYCYIIFAGCLLLYLYQTLIKKSWMKLTTDIFVIVLIASLIIDPRFYFNDFARHHQNFFLGPVNDILNGKDVLIDSYSQYGLFMPYFLALFFRSQILPMTYPGFTLLVSGTYIIYYSLIYFILRKIQPFQWLAIITTAAIIFFNYLAVWWVFMPIIPAQGPFRYAWPYLILAANLLGDTQPACTKRKKIVDVIELIIIGIAAIWSVEVFVYTLMTYIACQFYRYYSQKQPSKYKIDHFFSRVGLAVLVSIVCWLIFLMVILVRSKQIPQFNELINYLRFLTAYTYGSFAEEQTYKAADYIQRYWIIGLAVLFGSMQGCIFYLFSGRSDQVKRKLSSIAGLTIFGVLQFSYFFVYSFTGHFALVCVPIILLAAFWFSELVQNKFRPHIKTSVAFGYVLLVGFFTMQYSFYVSESRMSHTQLVYTIQYFTSLVKHEIWPEKLSKRFLIYHPWNDKTLEAEKLVNQYFRGQKRIAIFISPDDEVETLMRAGKTHIYPISNPYLVQVVPQIELRILSYPVTFKKGDHILVSTDRSKISSLERRLFDQINRDHLIFPILVSENYTVYEIGQQHN